MPIQHPKIDDRTYEDIVEQTEKLAQFFAGWRPRSDGQPDAGRALIRIFGRMASQISDRLNRSLDKNFLAYLDLIGTQIIPPQAAKVPLTFNLVEGSPEEALVPAGTQVAAPPAEGEEEEVVFETEKDLILTTSTLQAAFVRQPDGDLYSNYTAIATGMLDGSFPVFEATQENEHYLYLACDELLALPGNKTLTINLITSTAALLNEILGSWYYWNGTEWQAIENITQDQDADRIKVLVEIENSPIPALHTVNGVEARWLRVTLDAGDFNLPSIDEIAFSINIVQEAIAPDSCLFNEIPLDISKDFYPFGEQPHFNDTFYIASQEAFSRPHANITIGVKLSESRAGIAGSEGVTLVWEVGMGSSWEEIGRSSNDDDMLNGGNDELNDSTKAFTVAEGGDIILTLPDAIAQTTVNGESNYWIRVRIIQGNYGEEAYYESATTMRTIVSDSRLANVTPNQERSWFSKFRSRLGGAIAGRSTEVPRVITTEQTRVITPTDSDGELPYVYIPASFAPPSIESLTISYTYESESRAPSAALTYNNFTYISAEDGSFQPFVPNPDDVPTLYLGFDRPFPNLGMTLYAWVKLPEPGQIAGAIAENPDITPAKVIWEYSNADGWRSLGAKDETGAFSDRGMIRFIGPSDFVERSEFGKELYWLRVRWESNNIPVEPQESNFLVEPRLRQVLTNTVWAAQATTIPEEILGSSDGNPNQTFQATQTPILLNQQLSVLERAELSSAERAQVEADEGPDAIARVEDETGQLEGVWVTWHEMPDFYGSGANDRHYILDRITGEVQFGDGKYGKVPPLRRNNIRLAPYRTGGGAAGNKPAQTITELKTSVPYVESVTNREAASGGADRESIERLQERGPKALRHRDRAVTSQDIEDLAWEASPEVARAKAIGPQNDPLNMSWLPVYQFILNGPGNITVALSDFSGDGNIDVKIFGPGQSNPYLSEIVENQTANILYTVTQEQYDLSSEGEKPWSVILTNRGESIKGNISITYPGGTKNESFDAKATTEETDGRVELIIVPDKADAQPTPSLSLLELVDSYIRDRCSPSMNLVVTEPTWVEVKVTADIVPVNDDKGQEVKSDAVTALKKFLHPLTGGTTGVGWQFGRMPHESDFYAILEKVAGVDYVENLELDFKSEDDRSRNLVYSGEHQINLVSPNADD